MMARYGPWPTISEVHPIHSASFLWREICAHAPDVFPYTRWLVGDGHSISIIHDLWIGDLPFSRWPTFINIKVTDSIRVANLLRANNGVGVWNRAVVSHFREQLREWVLSLATPIFSNLDVRVWRYSCTPRVVTADLYQIYRRESFRHREVRWVWRIEVHPRVSLFL